MRKGWLALLSLVTLTAPLLAESGRIAPYYSLQLTQGSSIASTDEWMYSLNLVNDMGLMVRPWDRHRFIGFYELKYNGPGLEKQEGEKFQDSLMDHVFVLRYHYDISERYSLKAQADYMKEYKKSADNEVWSKGLYDFNRTGGLLALERHFTSSLSAEVNVQFHSLTFPNYSDLLEVYRAGGQETESSTGKQNQDVYQGGASCTWGVNRFSADFLLMRYTKQKLIVDAVQQDGTYYSGDRQQDTLLVLKAERSQRLSPRMQLSPSLEFRLKDSNQNYQHFTADSSSVPVRYVENYYDYSQVDVSLPFSVDMTQRWQFFLTPSFETRRYADRPPRDAKDKFIGGRQQNDLFTATTGFVMRPNPVTRTTFFYSYCNQNSNMKFERYVPYNYSGHFVGMSLNYTY